MTSAEYQRLRLINNPLIKTRLRTSAREKNRAKVLKETGKPVKYYRPRNS